MKNKNMKIKYNKGGSVSANKTIGDLDLSMGAAGNQSYISSGATASLKQGPFTMSHSEGLDHYKNKYNSGKINYSNSSLGVDTKAGRFGVDKKGNASYNYTTKGGTQISARGNKRGGTLSIFKEL
jgi:hypothetical protein